VRCMLGDSFRCDRAITRVYSYGLYVSPDLLAGTPRLSFDDVIFESPQIPKTIVLEVTVTKGTGHWCGGFKKTIRRRLHRIDEFHHSDEARTASLDACKKWCKQFKVYFKEDKLVPHGTVILVTWYNGKVITEINGTKTSEIENDMLGRAIFLSYYGNDNINPSVNRRTRAHYEHGIRDAELEEQERMKQKNECPQFRKCGSRLSFW